MRGNGSSEAVPEEGSYTARLPEWARERANGQWYGSSTAGSSPQRAKLKAPTNLIVVVPDKKKNEWAKARVFDNAREATALVETLMEEGLTPEQISIFSATQMVLDVAYQPVVEFKESRRRRKSRE